MPTPTQRIAIACGGTGGHLYPGLAVAEVLVERGWDIELFVSPKEVDQQGVRNALGCAAVTLPAVGWQDGNVGGFVGASWKSFRFCQDHFARHRPQAVLAMGSFTSAPPVLAAKRMGLPTFLHEANAIPGKANRWLAPWVDEVYVAFAEAIPRMPSQRVVRTGMPVRSSFAASDPAACRAALGLDPQRPVLLITGGSQGAVGVNQWVLDSVPEWRRVLPDLQFLHLAGTHDHARVRAAYGPVGARAVVVPFLTEMELALGAATVVVSRAGASSIAELAATGSAAILIPYPAAADNHQFFNARNLAHMGAVRMLEQRRGAAPELARSVIELIQDSAERSRMAERLRSWHIPNAAERIADAVLRGLDPSSGTCPTGVVGRADSPARGGELRWEASIRQEEKGVGAA